MTAPLDMDRIWANYRKSEERYMRTGWLWSPSDIADTFYDLACVMGEVERLRKELGAPGESEGA